MNQFLNVAVAVALLLLLVGYAATYTVSFSEAAIVTTFGGADESGVKNAPAADGTQGDGAGLYFKWPWPIQQVAARYDTRVQLLEAAVEQATTADQQSVVIRVAVTWRVTQPLAFYKSLGSLGEAESQLRNRVRAANGLVGDYAFADLANVSGRGTAGDDLTRRMAGLVQQGLDERGYGIDVLGVQLTKLEVPRGAVTQSVTERMAAERQLLAERAREEGEVQRARLVSEGNANASVIRSFADEQANEIRSRGEAAAAATLATLQGEAADLALLLDEVETIRVAAGERARFFIDAASFYPLNRLGEFFGQGEDRSRE